MSSDEETNSRQLRARAVLIAVIVLLFPFGYSVAAALFSSGPTPEDPFLALPENPEQGCIRDLEYMRFRHMDLLTEMRDTGVRGGAAREVTFTGCTVCHTSREDFCTRCHQAVNLTPDCFECHYYP